MWDVKAHYITEMSTCGFHRGICTQSPCYCIVMEYCPYGPLYDILRLDKQLPQTILLDWAKQIASGMTYLHSHKIIHRDLKSPKLVVLCCWCCLLCCCHCC